MTTTPTQDVAVRHFVNCVRYCTDDGGDGCTMAHKCWCADNGMTYADFAALHPDHDPSQAQDDELP